MFLLALVMWKTSLLEYSIQSSGLKKKEKLITEFRLQTKKRIIVASTLPNPPHRLPRSPSASPSPITPSTQANHPWELAIYKKYKGKYPGVSPGQILHFSPQSAPHFSKK